MSPSSSLPDAPPGRGAAEVSDHRTPPVRKRRGRVWKESLSWTRILHVYASMISLLVVLFFAVTGITLNHPEWDLGFEDRSTTVSGALPADWVDGDRVINFLGISEFVRDTHDVRGSVEDFGNDSAEGFISYEGPGYDAEVRFDLTDGTYDLVVDQGGLISVMNELHQGRGSGTAWSWLIDLSGGFLAFVALSGIILQLFLAKRRTAALWSAGAGLAILAVLWWLAVS